MEATCFREVAGEDAGPELAPREQLQHDAHALRLLVHAVAVGDIQGGTHMLQHIHLQGAALSIEGLDLWIWNRTGFIEAQG